jgi:hypothetical protein
MITADRIAEARQDILLTVTTAMRAWFEGDSIDGERVRAKVDQLLLQLLAEDRRDPAHAIDDALYALDQAGRVDGWIVQLTRQEFDAIVDHLKVAKRGQNQFPHVRD